MRTTVALVGITTGSIAQTVENIGAFVPTGLSADGSVVVGYQGGISGDAVRWENGTLTNLGDGRAGKISDDGTVIAGTGYESGVGFYPLRWVNGIRERIHLPWPNVESYGSNVSGDGSTFFGRVIAPNNQDLSAPFSLEDGVFRLHLGTERYSSAPHSSRDGSVFGGGTRMFAHEGEHNAIIWTSSGSLVLGSGSSGVAGISDDGTLALINDNLNGAFLYNIETGTQTPLPIDRAIGMSGDGSIIIGWHNDAHAIWTAEQGTRNLRQSLLEDYGVEVPSAIGAAGLYISRDGSTLVWRESWQEEIAWRLDLSPEPPIDIELELFDDSEEQELIENNIVELGQQVTARMTITAKSDLESNVEETTFVEEAGLFLPEQFELLGAPENLEIGSMLPDDTFVFEWTLKAVKSGFFTLETSAVAGLFEGDAFEKKGALLEGEVPGLLVEVVLPEETLQLEQQEQGDDLSEEPGYEPLEFDVIVRVSVPENAEPLQNITFQGFDASDGGLDIDLVEKTGLPDPVIADVLQQPVPFPVSVKTPSPIGYEEGPLLPGGDPVEFTVTVEATRPGLYDFAALVTASKGALGKTITARGNSVKELLGDIVLTVQLEVMNDPASVIEGEAVEISGVVENITFDETIKLDPIIVVNKGQGIPRGPVALDDPLPETGLPGIYEPLLTPDDEEKRSQFRLRVQTVSIPGIDQNIVGRRPVLIDFAIGGTITDKDGNERELKPENVAVEWGNGRHDAGGVTFLRCAVEPDPIPVQVLDPDTFFTIAAGYAIENLALGGKDALVGFGQLLSDLPSGLLGLANFSGQVQVEKQIAAQNISRWMWAWLDYKTDVWLDLESETRRQQLQLITDELIYYYGPKFETAEQIAEAANNGVRDYMLKLIDYRQRAYDASSFGYNDELARVAAEPFRPIGQIASEEAVAAMAVAAWIGRVNRSPAIINEVAASRRAAREEALEIAEEATSSIARRGEAGDPRVSLIDDPRKAIPRATPLTQKQSMEGWAVDKVSDENLIRMTKVSEGGMPIFVAVRSRADEILEWMKTRLGITPKPMTFKPKSVNQIDEDWLGYRKGVGYGDANGIGAGDRGATVLAEPLPREEVIRRLNERGADAKLRERVLDRYNQRWEEWYGAEWPNSNPEKSKFLELSRGLNWDATGPREIGTGTLDVPKRGSVPQPDDNFDTTGPGVLEARKFQLKEVLDVPDNEFFPAGRQYYECWLEDDLGTPGVREGVMRRIAGDIDIVSVGYADGSALTPGVAADTIAQNLQHAIYAQHPWTTSFENEKLFKKFLNDHRWHPDIEERGEPLLLYVNGERRAAWFHPTRAIDAQNPLQGMVWLDGGTADIENVVRFQKDMRGSLADPYESNPPAVKPTTSVLREALIKHNAANNSTIVATCAVRLSPSAGRLFRLGQNDEVQVRDDQGNWSPVDPATECGDGGILTLPETFLVSGAQKGDKRIPIIESLLGFDWREIFAIGKDVLIGAGTDKARIHKVVRHGSLVLEPALQFDYPEGTRIVALPDPEAPPIEPFVIDGIEQEILPGGQTRVNVRFRSFFYKTLMMESSSNLVDWYPVDPIELLGANFSEEGFRVGNEGEEAQASLIINPAQTEPLFFRLRPMLDDL